MSSEGRRQIEELLGKIADLEVQRYFSLETLIDRVCEILVKEGAGPSDVGIKLDETYREVQSVIEDRRKGLKRFPSTFDNAKRVACQDIRNILPMDA